MQINPIPEILKGHSFDEVHIEDGLIEVIKQYNSLNAFYEWLAAFIIVRSNAKVEDGKNFLPAVFRLHQHTTIAGDLPPKVLTLSIEEEQKSYRDTAFGDIDLDILGVSLEKTEELPKLLDRCLDYIRQQNRQQIAPTTKQIAAALNVDHYRAHNALVPVAMANLCGSGIGIGWRFEPEFTFEKLMSKQIDAMNTQNRKMMDNGPEGFF